MRCVAILLATVALFAVSAARADTVHLKTGERITGRVIDLEDTETHEKPADGEFVLDPFQSSEKKEAEAAPRPKAPPPPAAAAPPPAAAAAPPPPAAAPPPAEDDGITITIPVIITRSQAKKSIPLKINLDIQVVDEEV